MIELMDSFKKRGRVSLDDLSEWKTDLYDSLPESAFSGAKIKDSWKKFISALANDFKEGIEGAANSAQQGLGDDIAKVNKDWGSVLGAEKPTKMQIRRGETPNMFTSVDGILTMVPGSAGVLATKKAADLAKTTWARTKAGKALMKAGKSGIPQGLINRGIIHEGLVGDE